MLTYAERIRQMDGKSSGELFEIGLGYFGKGEEWEAEQWYAAAMEKGSPDAAFALARIRENQYRSKDKEESVELLDSVIELYSKASELGHMNAGIYLGNLYLAQMVGEDDTSDEDCEIAEKALSAYEAAGRSGNKEAYYYMAEVYGMGVLDDPANMFSSEFYHRGAKAGSFGGYLGLYRLAMTYGWDYIPEKKELVMAKLKELSPYPPDEDNGH